MPPLCTAGYGLASGHYEYFFGAFYLFVINTFFIALASILVVRYLRFPVTTFVSKERENSARRIIVFATLVIIIPSVYVFYNVVKETYFYREANVFIDKNISYEGCEIIKKEVKYKPDSVSVINLAIIGDAIPERNIEHWQDLLDKRLDNTILNIFQGNNKEMARLAEFKDMMDVFGQAQSANVYKEQEIIRLQEQIRMIEKGQFPKSVTEELKIQFPALAQVSIGMMMKHNFIDDMDTIPTLLLEWTDSLTTPENVLIDQKKIIDLLKIRLQSDSVYVESIN